MAQVIGLDKVLAALRDREAKARKDGNVSCVVGFTAAYALYVHEDLTAAHRVGRAKFLESAAREFSEVVAGIVRQALSLGRTMAQALLLGGLRLQREAQKRTPVDTGALKNSAFTRLERG